MSDRPWKNGRRRDGPGLVATLRGMPDWALREASCGFTTGDSDSVSAAPASGNRDNPFSFNRRSESEQSGFDESQRGVSETEPMERGQ
jgi:hypothetical protein